MPNPYTSRAAIAQAYAFKREQICSQQARLQEMETELRVMRDRLAFWRSLEGAQLAAMVDCYTPEEQAEVMRPAVEFEERLGDIWLDGEMNLKPKQKVAA